MLDVEAEQNPRSKQRQQAGDEFLAVNIQRLTRGRLCHVFPRLDNAAVTELLVPVDDSPASLRRLNAPITGMTRTEVRPHQMHESRRNTE